MTRYLARANCTKNGNDEISRKINCLRVARYCAKPVNAVCLVSRDNERLDLDLSFKKNSRLIECSEDKILLTQFSCYFGFQKDGERKSENKWYR